MSREEIRDSASESLRKTTSADFSFQFSAAREHQKVAKKIFSMLCDISKENAGKPKRLGILVVLGVFDTATDYIVPGMRQIGINPIQKYMEISSPSFSKDIEALFRSEEDLSLIHI